ncbi:MAG: PAS domain S-box protein [Desulfobacterales bacterium]|jgi:PAS domain S-box-containing protein
MKLRSILVFLSLLAIISTATGGFLYYSSIRDAALKVAERQAVTRLKLITKNISAFLSENLKVVKAMAGMDELLEMLVRPNERAQNRANAILDLYKNALEADVCYLMDYEGKTIASSNRDAPDSFVGKNFAFRPYFQQAFHSAPATYLALGITSDKRGVYYSYPIFEEGEDLPIGLAVIKGSIEQIEKELGLISDEIVLVTDPHGVVFISNIKDWLYDVIWQIGPVERAEIAKSRQFGDGPWEWLGFRPIGEKYVVDRAGNEYQMHQADIGNYPGWKVNHLRSLEVISKNVSGPLIRLIGPVVLSLCLLVGLAVFFLYGKASHELSQRKLAEKALRESEERYRTLYHNTPAMLHSINMQGYLVSVSDHWAEALGYKRSEVIGKKLTDFLTQDSRRYYEQNVFPEFVRKGACKDIPYQFVKKNGDIIDILLSAIIDREASGAPTRSLAVSIDVTERKRAEEALRDAKEALSRYSKNLERLVRKRTREITNILKYTPAVIYIKDVDGRYILVNPKYEQVFNVKSEDVKGQTDYDVLPKDTAHQFRTNDVTVLEQKCSYQFEETIVQKDDRHTYLSVKFPVYDESGQIRGVGSISTEITAVKKAQDQLRRLSGSIIANQEKERAALSRELHDELGQVLTALRMDAVWLRDRMKNIDAKAAARTLTMCDLIDETISDVRGMAFRLRPGVLDDLGLVDALENYTTDFEKRTGITCVFDPQRISEVTETIATAAYRITQEALTNVARHADAGHVDVQLGLHNGFLTLVVSDNGRGFNTSVLGEFECLGLAGMRERAVLAGGTLEVQSRLQNGTRVEFKVPFDGLNL